MDPSVFWAERLTEQAQHVARLEEQLAAVTREGELRLEAAKQAWGLERDAASRRCKAALVELQQRCNGAIRSVKGKLRRAREAAAAAGREANDLRLQLQEAKTELLALRQMEARVQTPAKSPHRNFQLQSAEFRQRQQQYLGSPTPHCSSSGRLGEGVHA